MTKKLSNLFVTELTQFSNRLDSLNATKKLSTDELEFNRFMKTLLEDCISKIQSKIQEKQSNSKFKFIQE